MTLFEARAAKFERCLVLGAAAKFLVVSLTEKFRFDPLQCAADIRPRGSIDGLEAAGRAADGEEGLKKALQLQPDVITLDLEMPRLDGYAFLRLLRARADTRDENSPRAEERRVGTSRSTCEREAAPRSPWQWARRSSSPRTSCATR